MALLALWCRTEWSQLIWKVAGFFYFVFKYKFLVSPYSSHCPTSEWDILPSSLPLILVTSTPSGFDPSLAAPPCASGKMQFLPKQKWSAAATLSKIIFYLERGKKNPKKMLQKTLNQGCLWSYNHKRKCEWQYLNSNKSLGFTINFQHAKHSTIFPAWKKPVTTKK